MSYDILLFDADRTLFDFDKSEEIAFYEVAPQNGVNPTKEIFEVYKKINLKNWEDLEKGLVTKDRLVVRRFEQLYEYLGITNGNAVKFDDDYLHALSKQSILYDYSMQLVDNLKRANKRIFLITNGVTKVQEGRIKGSPIEPYFEEVFISEQMGVAKPQKLFFDLVAQKIKGYDQSRAIVIGDSLTSDIQGANNANLACIWLNWDNANPPDSLNITLEAKSLKQVETFLLNN